MLLTKLEELRRKPKHVRDRYAFWLAALITLCVAGVWATTLPTKMAMIMGTDTNANIEKLSEEQTLGSRWSSMTASLRTSFNELHLAPPAAETAPSLVATSTATGTDMVWTEAAAAKHIEYVAPARIILIGTTSDSVATTTATTTNVIQ